MNGGWLPRTILRLAALLTPGDQRAEWLQEWLSELWYVPQREATRFSLGAARDALWLRRNNLSPGDPRGLYMQSPLCCLACVAAFSAAAILVVFCLASPLRRLPMYAPLRARDLPAGCLVTLGYSCLLLPAALVGRAPANRHPPPWTDRLRGGIFLVLKIALVQPIMVCGFIVFILVAPLAPFAPYAIGAV
jgi:hypothetical protein